ncbi:MAG: hypothetical protein E7520_05655 [Ruminococcaceae bacterium]|jgi:hypothetical protein|nr:hypothetical protein [Oscillospiraceae bacterium]
MKKIAVLMLALALMLCACGNQTTNKEGASQKGASSDVATTASQASDAQSDGKDSTTLATVDSGDEGAAVPFEPIDGDATTKKNDKEKSETSTADSSSDEEDASGYELPRVPLG